MARKRMKKINGTNKINGERIDFYAKKCYNFQASKQAEKVCLLFRIINYIY